MELSIVERLTLANQFKILAAIEKDAGISEDYLFKADILEKGVESEYFQIFESIIDEPTSKEVSSEVFRILEMFRKIKWSLKKLTQDQLLQIDTKKLSFRGFDGNNDKHFFFLSWWDEKNPDNYYREEFGDIGGYNSHTEFTLAEYRGMLEVFKTFDLSGPARNLTLDELKELEEARTIWNN